MSKVWIITEWTCGGGGDDDRLILGVYSDESKLPKLLPFQEIEVFEVDQGPKTPEL